MSTKTSQIKDLSINSTESPHTTDNPDPGNRSGNTLRQPKRLRGTPASTSNPELSTTIQAMPSESLPALPSSSHNNTTLMGVTGSDNSLDDQPFEDSQSSSTSPNASTKPVLNKSDIDSSSEYKETDDENIDDDPDTKQNKKKNKCSIKEPLRSKQDSLDTALMDSKKRKANESGGKKTANLALTTPPIKKQKVNNSTPKGQHKAGNSKPKTAKERLLAASIKDTRPLPWGNPDVWAEVHNLPCR